MCSVGLSTSLETISVQLVFHLRPSPDYFLLVSFHSDQIFLIFRCFLCFPLAFPHTQFVWLSFIRGGRVRASFSSRALSSAPVSHHWMVFPLRYVCASSREKSISCTVGISFCRILVSTSQPRRGTSRSRARQLSFVSWPVHSLDINVR